ncbi:MAG: sugar phosphate nucleotidyltransferase, partial [Desulfurococcaceae archaeon]
MKAIILAAGEGVRLRPITETRPKSMIPVLCRPALEWHVEA